MSVDNISVLVIDPKSHNTMAARGILSRAGIHGDNCDTAADAQQATSYFRERHHDLVISATIMGPNYPIGPNALREIRALGEKPFVLALITQLGQIRLWGDLADGFMPQGDFYWSSENLKRFLEENFPDYKN